MVHVIGRFAIKLRKLTKDESSKTGNCPAVYVAEEDPAVMVAQGKVLDHDTVGELQDRAIDEAGVRLPTETVLRAAGRLLAEHGRLGVADEIEAYLAEAGYGPQR
jgi:hypothetical protein